MARSSATPTRDHHDWRTRSRVAHSFLAAYRRGADRGHPWLPIFRLSEAIALANDLHKLGVLPEPPSDQWRQADAQLALSPWHAQVVSDSGAAVDG